MKSVADMIFQNDDIQKIKTESQYALLKEKNIQHFLKQNHLMCFSDGRLLGWSF